MNTFSFSARLAAGALVVACFAAPSNASDNAPLERLVDGAPTGAIVTPPAADVGAWRTWTELFWNREAARLERRRRIVFDPYYASDLALHWAAATPKGAAPGKPTGIGVLTWRLPQEPSRRIGVIAQYQGELDDGRFHGRGLFLSREGMRYAGHWRHGLMHGTGQLSMPNGSFYTGTFANGRPDGPGSFVDPSGRVFTGRFPGGIFVSESQTGVGRRVLRDGVVSVQLSDDVTVGIAVDAPPNFCCLPGPAPLRYVGRPDGSALAIVPDAPDLLRAWRGETNIVTSATPTETDMLEYLRPEVWNDATQSDGLGDPLPFSGLFEVARIDVGVFSYLNYSVDHLRPLSLLISLENSAVRPVEIVGLTIEVDDSVLEADPAIQFALINPFEPFPFEYSIENFGWAPAEDAELNFSLLAEDGSESEPFNYDLGTLEAVHTVDFTDLFEGFGLNKGELNTIDTACTSELCVRKTFAERGHDRVARFLQTWGGHLGGVYGVRAVGFLRYTFLDHTGTRQKRRSPFETAIRLGSISTAFECEGSVFSELSGANRPFSLSIGRSDYAIPIDLRDHVPPGVLARWRLPLEAEKSSRHRFRIVLDLADGRRLTSRDVSLLFYRPRVHGLTERNTRHPEYDDPYHPIGPPRC